MMCISMITTIRLLQTVYFSRKTPDHTIWITSLAVIDAAVVVVVRLLEAVACGGRLGGAGGVRRDCLEGAHV